MIFRLILLFLIGLVSFSVYAEDRPRVGEKEIKGVRKVKFINRTTKKASLASRRENENLGKTLALRMELEPERTHFYKGVTIKRYPTTSSEVLGADIVSLEENTQFGHINSLQRMLTSYIQNSFQFSEENAETIALYVVYYNAMHRNEKSYFKTKYDNAVVSNLQVDKTGLAISYSDWAGNSQIVIPLEYNEARGRQDIILDELEAEVNKISNNKIDPEEKSKMEEIKITRIEEDAKLIRVKDEKRKEEEAKKVTEIKPEIKTETKKIEKENIASLIETKPKTEERKPVETKREEIVTKPKVEEKREIREEKTLPPKTEERPVEKTKKENELEVKVKELTKENETLKIKEKDREEKSENVVGEKVLFLRLVKYEDDGHYTNELWVLDATNEQSLYKSPFTNICGKEFHPVDSGVVVLGFDGNRPVERVHRLVLLDSEKLSQKSVTKEEIFWRSHIVYRDGKIYAFEKYKNEVYLSRFNQDLSLDSRSSEPVNTNSEITFFKDRIFLTGKPGNEEETVIRILQRNDLKVLKSLKPIESKNPPFKKTK